MAVGHDGLVRDIRAGRVPGIDRLKPLFDVLGLELYFGPPRDIGPVEQITLDGTDFALVPRSKAELAAGAGVENQDEERLDYLAFRRTWLRGIGVAASQAVVAQARGDSMAPTIQPGDTLLIDTARREPPSEVRGPKDTRPAPIFALRDDGGARVKRIERAGGDTLMLLSDNRDFAPEVLDVRRAEIIGRVMWWGRTNRE